MRSTTMIAVIACMVSLAKGAPPPPGGVQGYQKRGDERLEQIRQDRLMKTRLDRANDDRDQPEDEVQLSCARACTYYAYFPEGNKKGLAQLTPRPITKDGKTSIVFEQKGDHAEFDTLIDYGYFGGVKSFANVRSFTNNKSPYSVYNVELGARGEIPNAMVYCSWKNIECDFAAKPRIITGPERTVVKYPIVGEGFDKELPRRNLGGNHEKKDKKDHKDKDHKDKDHKHEHKDKDTRQIRNKQGL
eukprot:GHVU01228360.1.p1 GENE.GHVU01228360.1~~GHVU01228360.1.p1  ORF type:complete len:245 (+),score=37.98 GHVU01228360.1:87-821(+)